MKEARSVRAAWVGAVVAIACMLGGVRETRGDSAAATQCMGVAPSCHVRQVPMCICMSASRMSCSWQCVASAAPQHETQGH